MFAVSCAGGVLGLLFDSVPGATLEERGWLNNDAVNFLSTDGGQGLRWVCWRFFLSFCEGKFV
jgi:uncharacterized membrane protein